MRGTGPRRERETVIVLNEEEEVARIWTASSVMFNKLKRMGYIAAEERDRSASFEIPKRRVSIRAIDRKLNITPERREALRKQARKLNENGTSSPDTQSQTGDWHHISPG